MIDITKEMTFVNANKEVSDSAIELANLDTDENIEIYFKILDNLKEKRYCKTDSELMNLSREIYQIIINAKLAQIDVLQKSSYDGIKTAVLIKELELNYKKTEQEILNLKGELAKTEQEILNLKGELAKTEQTILNLKGELAKTKIDAKAVARSVDDNYLINLANDYTQLINIIGNATNTSAIVSHTQNMIEILKTALPIDNAEVKREFEKSVKNDLEKIGE